MKVGVLNCLENRAIKLALSPPDGSVFAVARTQESPLFSVGEGGKADGTPCFPSFKLLRESVVGTGKPCSMQNPSYRKKAVLNWEGLGLAAFNRLRPMIGVVSGLTV